MKKFLSIILATIMLLSTFGIFANAEAVTSVSQKASLSDSIVNVFYTIKNTFINTIGLLTGDKRVNTDDYITDTFPMPGLEDGFIPQGVCFVDALNSIAVSGYMPDDENGNEQYSRIYLVNPETDEIKMFIIDGFTGHAGGIASDGSDIWLSSGGSSKSNGKIYHFTTDMFAESGIISYDGYFSVPVKGSVLSCDGKKLWVSEFYNDDKESNLVNEAHHSGKNHAWSCGYNLPIEVDYSAKEKLVPDVVLSIPDKVQGTATTDSGNVVFSTSYGRRNDSKMQVFEPYAEWDEDSVTVFDTQVPIFTAKRKNRTARFTMPTLMEGIDYHDGELIVIFESGAKAYSDAKKIIKDVWVFDIDSII